MKPPRVKIRRLTRKDMAEWLRLRLALWPDEDKEGWNEDMLSMLTHRSRWAQFVAEENGRLIGFLEASLRDYAEGCATSPVGYIEGWFVEEKYRQSGIGGALVKAAERWARERGCTEMASDALIDNTVSHRAHGALGYKEVERIVCFRKTLHARRARNKTRE